MMARCKCLFSFCFLLVLISGVQGQDHEAKAVKVVDFLVKHRFDSVYSMFSDEVKEGFSLNNLTLTWSEFERQGGGLIKHGYPRMDYLMGNEVWLTEINFTKVTYDLVLRFDGTEQLSGFRISLPAAKCNYRDPEYAKGAFSYKEIKTFVVCGSYKLPAILTLPVTAVKVPVVVMVHGSGPNDMDETAGNYKTFRDMALGLAANGIASLRYEKRSRVYGNKMAADMENFTVKEEVTDDALAAVKQVSVIQEIDAEKIFLMGHSLGALLAPRIAAQTNLLHGIIMLAANAQPLQNVVLEQYEYLTALDTTATEQEKKEFLEETRTKINQLNDTASVRNMKAEDLLLGLPATYWLDLINYHPTEVAKKLSVRLLIVQGGKDYQVTPKEYALWQKALKKKKHTAFIFFPELNHLMVPSVGKPAPAQYTQTKGNVPEELVKQLVSWINSKN